MRVIVTVDDPQVRRQTLERYGKVLFVLRRAKAIVMDADEDKIKVIASFPWVKEVVIDRPFRPGQADECRPKERITNIEAGRYMGLREPYQPPRKPVAVIDTGIAETDRINVIDRISLISDPTDNTNHGTWVAFTIGGYPVETSIGEIMGIAPGTPIIDVPVINSKGYTTMSTIMLALEASADRGANVMNLSLGGPYLCSEAMNNLTQELAREGIILSVASGNYGNNEYIGCPANSPATIAVGSVYYCEENGVKKFIKSTFTPIGSDIASIGGNVNPDQLIVSLGKDRPMAMAGTSMATPYVTIASALIKDVYPSATVDDVRGALAQTAFKPAKVPDPYVGYGVLNLASIQSVRPYELNPSQYYPTAISSIDVRILLATLAIGGAIIWSQNARATRNAYPPSKVALRF